MGWWPSKICVVLNWIIEIGYGLVDCLIAGLLLSAVNGHGMSPIVGIVISALITVSLAWFCACRFGYGQLMEILISGSWQLLVSSGFILLKGEQILIFIPEISSSCQPIFF